MMFAHVAGNVSILSGFFNDTSPVLIMDASLTSNLSLSEDHTAWTIHIEGPSASRNASFLM